MFQQAKVVCYESIKRELKTKLIYECRCDERLKTKVEESTRLACTVLTGISIFVFLFSKVKKKSG